jgi:hypothetical protein
VIHSSDHAAQRGVLPPPLTTHPRAVFILFLGGYLNDSAVNCIGSTRMYRIGFKCVAVCAAVRGSVRQSRITYGSGHNSVRQCGIACGSASGSV